MKEIRKVWEQVQMSQSGSNSGSLCSTCAFGVFLAGRATQGLGRAAAIILLGDLDLAGPQRRSYLQIHTRTKSIPAPSKVQSCERSRCEQPSSSLTRSGFNPAASRLRRIIFRDLSLTE